VLSQLHLNIFKGKLGLENSFLAVRKHEYRYFDGGTNFLAKRGFMYYA